MENPRLALLSSSSPKLVMGYPTSLRNPATPKFSISTTRPSLPFSLRISKTAPHASIFSVSALANSHGHRRTSKNGKLGSEYFASISSSSGKQTASVGVNPQPVSPPPSQIGSPLFWVGVGVGLSAIFSWVATRVKNYAMQQAFKSLTEQMNTQNNQFNPAFSARPPFPFSPPPASQPSTLPSPAASQPAITVDIPATKVEAAPTTEVGKEKETDFLEEREIREETKKYAFVDISPEETSLNTPFSSVEDDNDTSSSKDDQFAKKVFQNGAAFKEGPGAAEGSQSTRPFLSVEALEKMMEDPTMQKMVYPYLPEEMRNPTTFMKMRQMWVLMLLMALSFLNDRSHCCLDEERISVLEIKAWFNHAGAAGSYKLEGWDKEHFNCCNWDRVVCDNTTNRVIELHLSFVNYDYLIVAEDLDLNASLFLPFKELEILELDSNQLVGGLKNQGFQVLASGLRNLKELYLGSNKFNDSILSSLSGFSSLKSLSLSNNKFTESTGFNGFQVLASGLRNLKEFDLSFNKFNDSILSSLSGFSTLKYLDLSVNMFTGSTGFNGLRNLETLYLYSNDFKESVLIESLGALPSLKTLDASYSNFKHFGKGLCNSSSLEKVFFNYSSLPASFFRNIGHLSTLKVLSLNGVDFNSTLPAQGFQVLASGLRNLEELYLGDNKFNDSVLSSLSGFSSLKSLDLSNNNFTGSTGLNGLRNLETLYLYSNDFKESVLIESLGALPSLKTLDASGSNFKHFGKGLCNSSSLEEVSLDYSSLPASFLRNIGPLSTLKVLSLTSVDFNSTLPAQGWCELKNLEQLFLSGNNLKGVLPPCLGNLSFLQFLDVSNNQLNGNIASSHLSHLKQLKSLFLTNNYFQVPVSFGSFMNLSNLKVIACDNNELIAAPSFQPSAPKLQLLYFSASNCTSKPLKARFPNFLHSQHDLVFVDLSHNKFVGEPFPSWLFENNTKLNRLYLRDTSFTGPLQLPQHPTPNLQTVDMSGNNIHGQVARNICSIFSRLKNFMMANNSLTGCIPPCFGNMSSLEYLDLSNNHMSCELLEHNLPTVGFSLWFLKLSNNNFTGRLPLSVFNMTNLAYLFLDGNKFEGKVSGAFSLASSFLWFDISNNLLSGLLPRGIGNSSLNGFQAIDLSRNQFEGTIPIEYFNSSGLQFLDLSENNLFGSLPLGFLAPYLRYVHLYGNRLSGPLPYAFCNLSSLVTLDLGDNNLTGPIPNWIYSLSELSIFVLKSNRFNGKLPHQLCLLRKLSILDLSENNFSGPLPSCLSNLNFTESDEKTLAHRGRSSADDWIKGEIFASIGGRELGKKRFYLADKILWPEISVKIAVELTSKKNFYTYEGDILRYMSALDLSCNRFTGEIPTEWGNLSGIYSLNLSRNNLTGLIPPSFFNLKQIESLDLSHNNLNGRIPEQLVELTFLEVFNVSYNNLSGRTPEMKNQFGTFDESSYKGNPLLCGPPLQNSCDKTESPSVRVPNDFNGDGGFIDMDSFYASFGVFYIIVVLTIAAVLCINPYWRRRWFYFIEECIDTCCCFLAINFPKLSRFIR